MNKIFFLLALVAASTVHAKDILHCRDTNNVSKLTVSQPDVASTENLATITQTVKMQGSEKLTVIDQQQGQLIEGGGLVSYVVAITNSAGEEILNLGTEGHGLNGYYVNTSKKRILLYCDGVQQPAQ